MSQSFIIEIPKDALPKFLQNLQTQPELRIISQEDRGDTVVVIYENTDAPDLVAAPAAADDPPPPPPPPPGSLKAKPGKNQAVVDALIAGAIQHNLNPMMVLTIIAIESMYKPTVCNRDTSAAGLFQFIDSTWAIVSGGKTFPGRGGAGNGQAAGASITLQVDLGCKFTADNAAKLQAQLGAAPNDTQIYMAHQQGLGGALKILKANQANPNAAITTVISAQAAKLNGFEGLTVAQTVAKFAQLMQKMAVVARDQVLP